MRDEDFTVTQAEMTLPLLRKGTLLQNYLVSNHLHVSLLPPTDFRPL